VERETELMRGGVGGSLDRSSVWPYREAEPGDFYYQRYSHPAGAEAEAALGGLDGGEALLYPSGLGAATSLLVGSLQPGQTVAHAGDAYYGTGTLLRELEPWGIKSIEYDQRTSPPEGVDLVWIEAPSNPLLSFPDIAATAEAAHAQGARLVVDATAATPILCRPLEHGADIVLHSATKYLGGHSDVLLGALVCRDPADAERLREFRGRTGIVAAPDPAWLLLRGLKTLAVRVRRQSATALDLAGRLAAHPAVERVRYPGLGDETAARYMDGGFGGLLSFDVAGGAAAARKAETSVRVILNATSLGGVESLMESRRRWEGDRVPEGLLRLSVGLEHVEDLWADLEQALA
jgi:cystathionine gamma-synthase